MSREFQLPKIVFFGRTFAEYQEMFSFTETELQGKRILDCPSGPDSFVAESYQRGLDVTGCDPVYENRSVPEVYAQAQADIAQAIEKGRQKLEQFPTLTPEGFEAFAQAKLEAMEKFVIDYGQRPEAYVAGRLPELPFADCSFDWVFSAHFLLAYSSLETGGILESSPFDFDFHCRAVLELLRVAQAQIRLYPLYTNNHPRRRHAYVNPLIEYLEAKGHRTELLPSTYNQGSPVENFTLVVHKGS